MKNIGDNPCFVRVKVTGLDCLGTSNMITYKTDDTAGALGDNWVAHTDGYFYYTEAVAKSGSTTDLFDAICIPTTVTNGFDGNYDIQVVAEAVQAQGCPDSSTVAKLAGWFTTCMG